MSAAGAPAVLLLFDIGPIEFIVVVGAAIMLFGGDLPDVARKAGRVVRKLRTMASDVTRNLDVPADVARLPGSGLAAIRDEIDVDEDLDLDKDALPDWREVAALPDAAPAGDAPPAPTSRPTSVVPAAPLPPSPSTPSHAPAAPAPQRPPSAPPPGGHAGTG